MQILLVWEVYVLTTRTPIPLGAEAEGGAEGRDPEHLAMAGPSAGTDRRGGGGAPAVSDAEEFRERMGLTAAGVSQKSGG